MDEQLKKSEDSINKLLKIIAETNAFDDPSSLSNIMVRLAYYNHTIGRCLAALQGAYRQARSDAYNAFLAESEKKVVTHAKQKAEEAGQELETKYDHFRNVHDDTDKFITVCQSHLRILQAQANNNL